MSLRSLGTDLTTSLKNNEAFNYAHLVKFEKPVNLTKGQTTSRKANSYTYVTDGAYDIVYDDGSVDSQGNSNGPQIYRANKLKAVGNTTETTMAKVSSLSITLDTAALASEVTSKDVVFSASPKTIEFETGVDLIKAGFREGDRVLFTATTGGSGNNEKTVIIDSFLSEKKFSYISTEDTITAIATGHTFILSQASPELNALISDKSSTTYTTYINREVFVYKAHRNVDTNAPIGEPYLLFKGITSSASIKESPDKQSAIVWTLTSHWGDFSRVSGRLTVDEHHRALD
jgi:hypothetical protein